MGIGMKKIQLLPSLLKIMVISFEYDADLLRSVLCQTLFFGPENRSLKNHLTIPF